MAAPDSKTVGGLPRPPTLLFDGTCHFCNGAVQFIVDHERSDRLRFAPLQSDFAKELLTATAAAGDAQARRLRVEGGDREAGDPDTLVLVEDGRAYTYSSGALRTARHLRWPWSWLVVLTVVPRPLRDAAYRWFARHRYRWFGKSETCRVPSRELRARFLG
jgi:predicted DCC family thiol-disulfide oxidoreductase YuxK